MNQQTATCSELSPVLAAAFVEKIRSWLSDEDFEEICRRNRSQQPGICASHDFCDANMAMHSAFTELMGRSPNLFEGQEYVEHDIKLWNDAWEIATRDILISPIEGIA
jgi:hypothetical protein